MRIVFIQKEKPEIGGSWNGYRDICRLYPIRDRLDKKNGNCILFTVENEDLFRQFCYL